jgi:hypothetical protein
MQTHVGKPCRHCRKVKKMGNRGPCRECFAVPSIKRRYRPLPSVGVFGVGLGFGGFSLPPAPTTAAPGTAEKVAVLEERARRKVWLWHPLDGLIMEGSR